MAQPREENIPVAPEAVVPVAQVESGSLRTSTWSGAAIWFALAGLAVLGSRSLLPDQLPESAPNWMNWVVFLFLPHAVLLLYPLITRHQGVFPLPRWRWSQLLRETVLAVGIVILGWVLLSILLLILVAIFPDLNVKEEGFERMTHSGVPVDSPGLLGFMAFGAFVAPLAEEVFFRGFLFNAFRQRMPVWLAMLLASLLFAAIHLYSLLMTAVIFVMGCCLTLIYLWRRTLLAPILVHTGWNSLMMVLALIMIQYYNTQTPVVGFTIEKDREGIFIREVVPDSPAESAGLLPGDEITHLDDLPMPTFEDFVRQLQDHYSSGDLVTLTIRREGQVIRKALYLASRSSVQPPE